MINKLRKKLMVLFLTFTMIIFSLAMFLMMSNAIVEVRDSRITQTTLLMVLSKRLGAEPKLTPLIYRTMTAI